MGGVGFATIAAILVEPSRVGGSEGVLMGLLVVVGAGSSGVNEEIFDVVVFEGCEPVDL